MNLEVLEINLVTATFWISLVSFILFLVSVTTRKTDSQKSQITSSLGFAGMIFTGLTSIAALAAKWVVSGHVPWSNFYESMVLMTALAAIMFVVMYRMYKNDLLGVIMSPGIVLLVGIASILPKNFRGNAPLVPALQSYWIKIHTTAMIVSYSVFLLATTTAIAYLIMYQVYKAKGAKVKTQALVEEKEMAVVGSVSIKSNEVLKEDSSDSITEEVKSNVERVTAGGNSSNYEQSQLNFFDDLTYRLILFGFPILAFGIITGAMWANHAWGTYWSWDPKETASLMTWLFYGAYLHSRVGMNIKGTKSAIIAIVGFVSVIFTYYGVNYLPGLHSYGFSV